MIRLLCYLPKRLGGRHKWRRLTVAERKERAAQTKVLPIKKGAQG